MKLDKLKTEAVKTAKRQQAERLNDSSLREMGGRVYCTACPMYHQG